MTRPVLVLVPEVVPAGGVQVFSRDVIAGVRGLVGDERTVVLSRNDATGPLRALLGPGPRAVGLGGWPRRLRPVLIGPAAARRAGQERPGAVLALHPHLAAAGAAAAAGVPTLGFCFGIDVWGLCAPGWRNGRVRRGLGRLDKLLSISRYTTDRLLEQAPELSPKMGLLHPTLDTDRFRPAADRTDGPVRRALFAPAGAATGRDGPTLLTVARLASTEGPKGYDDVVRALPRLSGEFPGLRYVLAGKGPDAERVRALAASLGVADRVILPGFVPDADLPALYRAADLFLMPSRKEGFGIVFLEAMACGTPVVAGNADGSADAVCDGELGATVPPGDLDALTDAARVALGGRRPEPAEVRRKVVERFGRAAFRRRLAGHLRDLAPDLRIDDPGPVPAGQPGG